jgi:hypothetical protein
MPSSGTAFANYTLEISWNLVRFNSIEFANKTSHPKFFIARQVGLGAIAPILACRTARAGRISTKDAETVKTLFAASVLLIISKIEINSCAL